MITLGIFGLGGLAGSLITARVIKSKIEQVQTITAATTDWRDEGFPTRMVHEMEVRVKLSPDQVKQVRSILRRSQQEILRLNGEWQQKLAELEPGSGALLAARGEWRMKSRRAIVRSDESVREILTREQHPLFEEFLRWRRLSAQPARPAVPRAGERVNPEPARPLL